MALRHGTPEAVFHRASPEALPLLHLGRAGRRGPAAERDPGTAGPLTVAEREELVQLRGKIREMEETLEVLGKESAVSANRRTK
ncbi:hypothetical protein GCM10017668_62380 [Streptomyces tuirus]|uniref:Transposase n=1 Tax=Streptomyces tuirus TaxID=68278 RepID=A0A7G1NTK6_9ACTN|nr:hypothetical protein GCM10017668_62380 [Streptomyces tuirus]